MADSMKQGGDPYSGLVEAKGANTALFQQNANVKKETWNAKPKA
jgi:hypothetical protein